MADSDMLRAAEAEVARLEAELAETPAFKKLQLAKQVVELYRITTPAPAKAPRQFAERTIERILEVKRQTKASKIEELAVAHLRKKGARATSTELLKVVVEGGVQVSGAEPNKALSAYLSNSDALNNVRELGGYGLVEWELGPGPSSVLA